MLAVALACAAQLLQLPQWRETYLLPGWLGLVAAFAAAALGLAYLTLFARGPVIRRVAIELAAMGAVLVLVELAIVVFLPPPDDRVAERMRAADRLGIAFDSRTKSEVVAALRRDGVDAYPGTGTQWAQVPAVRRHLPAGFYPFSHASNVTVVECNESGAYHTYESDDWGFNNPPGVLDAGDIEVALVGESYALGHCLPAASSLAGLIRAQFPRTANFGMAGTTALLELGVFREYVEPLRPPVVVWTVNPHFVASEEDLQSPVLKRYLDPSFSQRLIDRQPETDRLVRELSIPVQAELDEREKRQGREEKHDRILGAWRLPELRAQLGIAMQASLAPRKRPPLDTFRQALSLAHEATQEWGGTLIVVLLPIYPEVVAGQLEADRRHDSLAQIVAGLGIPYVDGVELFSRSADPAALYTMRINNHPTAEGYALLASGVVDEIRARHSGLRASAQ